MASNEQQQLRSEQQQQLEPKSQSNEQIDNELKKETKPNSSRRQKKKTKREPRYVTLIRISTGERLQIPTHLAMTILLLFLHDVLCEGNVGEYKRDDSN